MTPVEQLSQHIKTISTRDWEKLFSLIPAISSTTRFGELKGGEEIGKNISFGHYWQSTQVVDDFVKIAYELKIIVVFDWKNWEEGKNILNNVQSYEELDISTLCKLLTSIVRNDKFCDGFLIKNFENGIILKVISAIEQKINTEKIDKKDNKMEKNNTHLAGEYFVSAELYKRGFSVAMTIGNAKSIDILAQKDDNNIAIQVKALSKKNCFDLPISKVKPKDFYIFVILNDTNENPNYFILTGGEILSQKTVFYGASLSSKRETINYGPLVIHQNKWEKLEPHKNANP